MLNFHLACLLTKYLSITTRNPRVAVLYDPATGGVEAWSGDTRVVDHDVGTAAVNLQRGHRGDLKRRVVLVSDPPEMISLGMAALTGVTAVVYFDGRRAVRYAPGNDDAPRGEYVVPAREPVLPELIQAWATGCGEYLQTDREREFATEFANVPAVAGWPALIQDFILDGPVDPRDPCPPAPPAQDGAAVEGRQAEVDAFWMTVARRLAGLVHIGPNRAGTDRHGYNIACVLVDLNNRVLAWGVNTVANHPTRHAETKCIWMYQALNPGALVPKGATLYTTLQSCLMCAATIKHACGHHDVRVVYADADKVGASSVLNRPGGAEEVPLLRVLVDAGRQDLLAGQLMLARARWDRLRRAFQQRLHRPPGAERDGSVADEAEVGWFRHVMRRDPAADLAALSRRPLPPNLQAQLDGEKLELRNAHGKEAGIAIATRTSELREQAFGPRRMLLQTQAETRERIRREATNLDYTGGAPVLLLNPVAVERLYDMPRITRNVEISTDARIRDLTTQIHALDLLLQAVRLPGYEWA